MSDIRPRVLIVERDGGIRRLQKALVQKTLGTTDPVVVDVPTASAEVKERFSEEPFHLLLIDVSQAQPFELIQELLYTSRTKQRCPTIAFSTGRVDRDVLAALVKDHCYALFPKPFDPSDVADAVRESLNAQAKSPDGIISPVLHGIMRFLHGHE